jgi:hypothetical protein
MSSQPKGVFEIANELVRNSEPGEMMKQQGEKAPSLDDLITNEVRLPSRTRDAHNDRR